VPHANVLTSLSAAVPAEVTEVLLLQQPCLLLDGDEQVAEIGQQMKEQGVCAVLLLPMVARGQTVGLIELGQPDRRDMAEPDLTALEQEAERQARLIEDILQLSRIDAGRLESKAEALSLDVLSAEAVASHQVMARQGGVTLHYTSGPAELMIWADHRMAAADEGREQ
jgi:signal transduction histidine kinase